MTCLVSWEVVRENILCASEIEGGELLFIPFLFFLQNCLVGQRHTGAKAVSEWPCQHLWRSQQQQDPQLANADLCLGKQGKVGGGNARKKRKVLDKIVGRGLAAAAEWAVADVPSQQGQPRHLLQHYHLCEHQEGLCGYTGEDCGSGSFAFVNWVLRLSVSIFWLLNPFWLI